MKPSDCFGFDFDAFVEEARKARRFAETVGDVMVAWNPEEENRYFHAVKWLAEVLDKFRQAPFAIVITWDDKVQLWTNYFDCWSRELVDAIFAVPSDADPTCIPVDPTPMHQPVPVPVPELDWQKDQKSQQDLIEQNQKTREEIKRILGQ